MFAYNPSVNDNSGQILAAGQVGAAQANAQMMGQVGQDIGGALAGIGQMFGEMESRKAKGRAFKKTMEVMGPSLGMTTDKLKAAFGDVKTDMDYANLSDSLMPVLPSWVNSTLASSRIEQAPELQQLRDAAATGRMYDAEQLRREREMLKTPAAPNPLSVPTAMRRFNNKPTP
jgi:hypothetical protein